MSVMRDRCSVGASTHPSGRQDVLAALAFALASCATLQYVVTVLPLEKFLPALNRWPAAAGLAIASFIFLHGLILGVSRRYPDVFTPHRLINIALAMTSVLTGLIGLDLAWTAHTNLTATTLQRPTFEPPSRHSAIWDGEIWMHLYFPTERNFYLHKPSVEYTANSYGACFQPELLKFKQLVDSALECVHVSYSIDKHGFRSKHDPAGARVFALGDSFCFGQHADQDSVWVERLGRRIGQPVYNLGISATSPFQQYLLLKYLLESSRLYRPKVVLWTLFEGNDLEDTYEPNRPREGMSTVGRALHGTIVETLAALPGRLRSESVLGRLWSGGLSLRKRIAAGRRDPYRYGDLELVTPLYHSAKFGYKFFDPTYTARLTEPEAYFQTHPHRRALEETFRRMRGLSEKHGFEVVVVIAPTGSRLYGEYFEDFPRLSSTTHFINLVVQLSRESGFRSLNLHPLLKPYAERELLYYRDDTHWNDRGHQVVADLVAAQVFPPQQRRSNGRRPAPAALSRLRRPRRLDPPTEAHPPFPAGF
jgi:hypothetical protein